MFEPGRYLSMLMSVVAHWPARGEQGNNGFNGWLAEAMPQVGRLGRSSGLHVQDGRGYLRPSTSGWWSKHFWLLHVVPVVLSGMARMSAHGVLRKVCP